MIDDLVERLRKRAADDRAIQANNEVVATALRGQRLLFDQDVRSDSNRFAVRLSLDYEGSAKNDAKLAADWDSAADRIEALTADFARQVKRTDEQREAYEQALAIMEADNARLREALNAVVNEYEMQMHGPVLHSIEAANVVLNIGKADK